MLQIVYERPGVALTTIVSEDLPQELPGGIKQLFRFLYGQGKWYGRSPARFHWGKRAKSSKGGASATRGGGAARVCY